jgi:hypothetical protein
LDVGEDADVDDHAGETQEPETLVEGLDVAEFELVLVSQDSFILFSNHFIFFDIQPAFITLNYAKSYTKTKRKERRKCTRPAQPAAQSPN